MANTANSIWMESEDRDERIARDLFFEQEVDVLAISYRSGLLRSIFVLVRSLFLSRRSDTRLNELIKSHTTVAVVFFQNEFNAILKAPATLHIGHVVRLNLHALAPIREQLGWLGVFRESYHFLQLTLSVKGWRHVGRLTYPLLGWLLYRTFQSLLAEKTDVTLITTNMQHPVSIGVTWAAVSMQQAADFLEHATTPRVVVRNRGYRNVYVNFEHTRHMLIESGFDSERVHVLQSIEVSSKRAFVPVRTVGICVNFFDSLEAISDMTEVLSERSLRITYRVHDADPRLSKLKQLAGRLGAFISDARQSDIESFLGTVDLILAGNSNVIADALMAGRPVVYYWSGTPEMSDYYGLVSHYQIPQASDKSSLRFVMAELLRTS